MPEDYPFFLPRRYACPRPGRRRRRHSLAQRGSSWVSWKLRKSLQGGHDFSPTRSIPPPRVFHSIVQATAVPHLTFFATLRSDKVWLQLGGDIILEHLQSLKTCSTASGGSAMIYSFAKCILATRSIKGRRWSRLRRTRDAQPGNQLVFLSTARARS
jgi:hypothetical protein